MVWLAEWLSILIAFIATLISLVTFWLNYKREKDKHVPVFIINKVTEFNHHTTIQMKNTKENYSVIKDVCSTDERIQVIYQGVMDVVTEKKKGNEVVSSKEYRGHTIDVIILSQEEFEAKIYVKGVDYSGKIFKVCTPNIQFKNGNKITNIQHRYLEFK